MPSISVSEPLDVVAESEAALMAEMLMDAPLDVFAVTDLPEALRPEGTFKSPPDEALKSVTMGAETRTLTSEAQLLSARVVPTDSCEPLISVVTRSMMSLGASTVRDRVSDWVYVTPMPLEVEIADICCMGLVRVTTGPLASQLASANEDITFVQEAEERRTREARRAEKFKCFINVIF